MPYYGEVEFEFPLSKDKNVTIIYAPNDTGKSSLYDGIIFTFYGVEQTEKLKDFINENAFQEKNYNAYVSIIGEHNGTKLEMVRSIFKKDTVNNKDILFYDELDIYENGNKLLLQSSQDEYFDFINAIVHKEVSKYFFFDGEKVNTYHIASGSENKDAIKRILGLKEIENAQGDFLKLKKEYERDRDRILLDVAQATQIINQKNLIETEMEELKRKIFDAEIDLKCVKKQIIGYEEELKKHEELKELIQRKQKIKKQKEEIDLLIDNIELKKNEIFKNKASLILGGIIWDEIRRDIDAEFDNYMQSTIKPDVKLFLEELTKRKACICGNELGRKQIYEINKFISEYFVDDGEYQKQFEKNKAFSDMNKQSLEMSKAHSEYYVIYSNYCDSIRKQNDENARLTKLDNEIRDFIKCNDIINIDDEKVESIMNNISTFTQKQYELIAEIKELNKSIPLIQSKLDKMERKLNQFINSDKKAAMIERKVRLAENISKVCNEYLEILTRKKRIEVEENATKIFRELTNRPNRYKGLLITDNYSFKLELMDGTIHELQDEGPKNPSTGQKKIIGLSYIAAINKSSDSIAPIIIDNPLGLFSEDHRTNVVKYLPRFGKQVIFMVTRDDLSNDYRKIVEPYVNCEYDLVDGTDTYWPKTKILSKVVY